MNDCADNSTTLRSDYTLILRDDLGRKSVLHKRECVRSKTPRNEIQSKVDQTEEFDDDLVDSIHLTRKRLNVHQSHRPFENINDIDDLEKDMIQDHPIQNKALDGSSVSEKEEASLFRLELLKNGSLIGQRQLE
jgi:hypothetical protein